MLRLRYVLFPSTAHAVVYALASLLVSLDTVAAIACEGSDSAYCMSTVGDAEVESSFLQLQSELQLQAKVEREAIAANSSTRPHIIFVLADDLGANQVGYTNPAIKTPFIDKLASEGVKLSSYYAGIYCAPARFSFLTGRDGWKSEAGADNFRPGIPIGTSTKYKMLPAALKAAGYATHMIGKWHQGFHTKEYTPRGRGFDSFFGILTGGIHHFDYTTYPAVGYQGITKCDSIKDLSHDGAPVHDLGVNGTFLDDRFRSKVYELITNYDKSKPLFLYLALMMPHAPYEVPKVYSSMYNTSDQELDVFYGMSSHLDDSVKIVVSALKQVNMYDNSLVVFSSDNGAPQPKAIPPFNGNLPFRGYKDQVYEGGLRVPAFVTGGFLPRSAMGRTLEGIVSITDWYATFARIAGFAVDDISGDLIFKSDSIDNWNYLSGQSNESARNEFMYHYAIPATKGRVTEGFLAGQTSSFRQGKWKLVASAIETDTPLLELFDLSSDPSEEHDVKNTNIQIASKMEAQMRESHKIASAMPWFHNERLYASEDLQQRACARWTDDSAKGYITPYAKEDDEHEIHFVRIPNTSSWL